MTMNFFSEVICCPARVDGVMEIISGVNLPFPLYPHLYIQAAIRKELNEFKSSEMEVHEESRIYTRYVLSALSRSLQSCSYESGKPAL